MHEPKYITLAQARALSQHTDDDIQRAFVLALVYTGARLSEILALRSTDVDIPARTLSIPHLKSRAKKPRRIPIAKTLTNVIRKLLADVLTVRDHSLHVAPEKGRGLKQDQDPEGVNDEDEKGRRLFAYTRIQAYRIIRQASIRSGIRTQDGRLVHPHALRHTFAVAWIRAGGKIEMLQRYLGHANPKTTSQYLCFAPDDLRREQDRIFRAKPQ